MKWPVTISVLRVPLSPHALLRLLSCLGWRWFATKIGAAIYLDSVWPQAWQALCSTGSTLLEFGRLLFPPILLGLSFFFYQFLRWSHLSPFSANDPPMFELTLDNIIKVVTLLMGAYSGVYVTAKLFKRSAQKEQIEYFEKKAGDLEKRYALLETNFARLEGTVSRYRMANDYYIDSFGHDNPVVRTAQRIIGGELKFRERRTEPTNGDTGETG